MFCRNNCFNHKPILLALVLAVTAGKLMAGDAPLAIAAMERDFASVRALLAERGADVNALGPYDTPALHWRARAGRRRRRGG